MAAPDTRVKRKSKPRWHRRKGARHGEIVAAALGLFVERGFAATTLDDVARRAGVTKGTVYLYFKSKAALLKAIVRETIVPAIATGEQLLAGYRGSAADLVRRLILGWWDTLGDPRLSGIPKLVMAEAGNFPALARFYYDEVISRAHRLMASALERGIASGEFRPLHVPSTVRLAVAPLLHAANWQHSFALCTPEGLDVTGLVDAHMDIFLRGIAKHPE